MISLREKVYWALVDAKHSRRNARVARFYHSGELRSECELTLAKSASHHLITVLRIRRNDVIQLFNGDGYNYRATVLDTGQRAKGKCAVLEVHERVAGMNESPLCVTLVQAISRSDRMEVSLRQSVELGVRRIQPVYSRHSVKSLDEKRTLKKKEHWQSIIVSACEQSGRSILPSLATPITLQDWLESRLQANGGVNANSGAQRIDYMLAPGAACSLSTHVSGLNFLPTAIGILIGPESGFDSDEIECAISSGVQAVSFGPRILRTETAGPAAITSLQTTFGDLGHNQS